MTASRTIATAALLVLLGPTAASAQSKAVDYILIERMEQTFVGQHPLNSHDWMLPGGGCLAITGPGGVGGNPQRTSQQMVANGWNAGPNGVVEWGRGDDLNVGPVDATWSVETSANAAHSGVSCLTDSPAGMSASDASATVTTVFDLSGHSQAALTFWHHWEGSYGSGGNVMYVETRVGAGAWQTRETYTYFGGIDGSYVHETVDLTPVAGNAAVQVRFRVDASTGNGWTIDDILLLADGEVLFIEDFETGTDGWSLAGTWGLLGTITDTPYLPNDALGTDRLGNPLISIDTDGVVTPVPVGLPTGTREGMGYGWVQATFEGHEDGVLVYAGAMSYVPE
jgi:hypothetical protein